MAGHPKLVFFRPNDAFFVIFDRMNLLPMKHFVYLLSWLLLAGVASCGNPVRDAIERQLNDYPESRVQDIYKSFCQDNLGPEHLIPNPDAARNYLLTELEQYRADVASGSYGIPASRFFPTGDNGNYIRVDLSVVLDSLITSEELLAAFVESANAGQKMTGDQWKAKWASVASVLRREFPDIPDLEPDLNTLDSLMAEEHFIVHHSRAFNAAYHPHYRIIDRQIVDSLFPEY